MISHIFLESSCQIFFSQISQRNLKRKRVLLRKLNKKTRCIISFITFLTSYLLRQYRMICILTNMSTIVERRQITINGLCNFLLPKRTKENGIVKQIFNLCTLYCYDIKNESNINFYIKRNYHIRDKSSFVRYSSISSNY